LGKRGRPKKGEENLALQGIKYGTREHWILRLDRDGHAVVAVVPFTFEQKFLRQRRITSLPGSPSGKRRRGTATVFL
jgi:hypothetical protein